MKAIKYTINSLIAIFMIAIFVFGISKPTNNNIIDTLITLSIFGLSIFTAIIISISWKAFNKWF